jgi:hypothetical protein
MPLSPRARRWSKIAAVAVVLLLVLAWWVDRQLEPERLTRTVLARAGASLQLDLRFDGVPEYALRPEPRLVLPEFSARGRDGKVFLSARRLEVSLPWDTLTGGEPVITRVELEAPRLDAAGLQRWLDSRPKEPFKVPTLSKGIAVTEGNVVAEGWSLQGLSLELPTLAAGRRAIVSTRGELLHGETRVGFDGKLDLASAGLRSGFDLRSTLSLVRKPKPLQARLAMRGRYALDEALDSLRLDAVQLKADSPLPSFDGSGALAVGQSLAIDFSARLVDWPKDWPQLPGTLAGQGANLPVKLSYRGDKAFNGPLSLHAEREATVVDARLRVPEFMRWFDDRAGAVLPPLTATLKTPALEFDGVKLEGVELQLSDEGAAP